MTDMINENLHHRGVRFAITRVGLVQDAAFGWVIYPFASGRELPAVSGTEDGPGAFGRAYSAARTAIDEWLILHLGASPEG